MMLSGLSGGGSVHSDSGLSAAQKAAIIAHAKGRIGAIVHNTRPIGSGSGAYYGPGAW